METNYFPGKDCRQIPAFASAALCSEVKAGSMGFHQRGHFPTLPGYVFGSSPSLRKPIFLAPPIGSYIYEAQDL